MIAFTVGYTNDVDNYLLDCLVLTKMIVYKGLLWE